MLNSIIRNNTFRLIIPLFEGFDVIKEYQITFKKERCCNEQRILKKGIYCDDKVLFLIEDGCEKDVNLKLGCYSIFITNPENGELIYCKKFNIYDESKYRKGI